MNTVTMPMRDAITARIDAELTRLRIETSLLYRLRATHLLPDTDPNHVAIIDTDDAYALIDDCHTESYEQPDANSHAYLV